ncbi:hypothetical protein RND81_01G066200 [Saponaria officinalis]|uniref:Uncharacterized protein n=1 Tax=Saponaria officinalis TaxID=3572 RepID=A0AAW1NGX9_SAPOF
MDAVTFVTYMCPWLITLALILLTTRFRHRKLNPPPGPKPWPIIGNFHLIGPLPHRSLNGLSKKYGPIMMVHFGSFPTVVASSVETAKIFLKTHDLIFSDRPKTAAGKYTTYNYMDITWSQYGPYWRQARKLCLIELFSTKRLESYEYIRVEELNSMLKSIFQNNNKPILIKDYLTNLSLNVISRMVLGKKYLDENNENSNSLNIVSPKEFKTMLDELFLLNGVFNLGDWIPCIKWLDIQGYVKRMKILGKKFDKFMEHVLDEHNDRRINEKENWVAKDMVDVLLQFANDPKLEVKFERIGVKAFSQDLIAGGTESSAVTVEWAMAELIRKPEVITKAIEELDRVIGKERWVQESDIQHLPYIRAIAKETMRLHPVAPMLVPRMSRENVKVQGYDIPKGSVLLVNTFTIQRDPKVYENPEVFWPERFIENKIDVMGHDFELLPFGTGRRMCPGYSLGLKVIESSLANLIHGFNWKLPQNMKSQDVDMEELFGLSNPKRIPLTIVPEPRLPNHLY